MERTLLVSDGDTGLGSELVRLLGARGCRVVTTVETGVDRGSAPAPAGTSAPAGMSAPVTGTPHGAALSVPWNRRSPVSAANLLLTVVNTFGGLDEALILDVPRAAEAPVHQLGSADIEKAIDNGLKPAVFLTRELLGYFLKKKSGVLCFVSFSERAQDVFAPALEQALREGFKGLASSVIASYAESGLFVNAFQSFASGPLEFAAFIEKTLEDKARRISGRWFTFQPRAGLFGGVMAAPGKKG